MRRPAEVNEAAEEKKPLMMGGGRQQGIRSSFASGASEQLDSAFAELFYGENLDQRSTNHAFASFST